MEKPTDDRVFNWLDADGKTQAYPVADMSDKGKEIFEDLARVEVERIRLRKLLKDQDLLFQIYASELKEIVGVEDVKKENSTGDT
tara:strand:- start:603 stop:857 length:255 start_codon:yes stop_codon:yes gene_type:complete